MMASRFRGKISRWVDSLEQKFRRATSTVEVFVSHRATGVPASGAARHRRKVVIVMMIAAMVATPASVFAWISDGGTILPALNDGAAGVRVSVESLGMTTTAEAARGASDGPGVVEARNRAAFESYQARLADYKAKEAAYQADKKAREEAYAASLAAHQSRVADWEARVKACKSGDRSQCAH